MITIANVIANFFILAIGMAVFAVAVFMFVLIAFITIEKIRDWRECE